MFVKKGLTSEVGLESGGIFYFLRQLQDAIRESFCRGWTTWYINIHRHDSVAASQHRVRVVVVATSVRTASHGDDVARLVHLIVDLSQSRSHFICDCACHYNTICLSRCGSKYDSESVHVISWCSIVHHLNSATCQTEGQRPDGGLPYPVYKVVHSSHSILKFSLRVLKWRVGFPSNNFPCAVLSV